MRRAFGKLSGAVRRLSVVGFRLSDACVFVRRLPILTDNRQLTTDNRTVRYHKGVVIPGFTLRPALLGRTPNGAFLGRMLDAGCWMLANTGCLRDNQNP